MDKKTTVTLEIWRLRSLRNVKAHYKAAEREKLGDEVLTGLNVAASVMVVGIGLAVSFGNLQWPVTVLGAKINGVVFPLGFFSVVFLITTLLQYFFAPCVKAVLHKKAGAEFAAINRRIEQVIATNTEIDDTVFLEIRHSLDKLGAASPIVSEKMYNLREDIGKYIAELEGQLAQLVLDGASVGASELDQTASPRAAGPKLVE